MMTTIRRLLLTKQFEPFAIQTSGGEEYLVPTADHAAINPRGTAVIVFFDDDSHITLSALRLVGVKERTKHPAE